jgi:hypothetical protein
MEALDPRSLKDWSEAFQQPIPNVRIIEQRVRRHADENRQKLRSLVGASYRDLLGTADRIIQMDEQMQLVESNLGSAGQNCNSRAVEKLFSNYVKFNSEIRSRSMLWILFRRFPLTCFSRY